MVGTKLMPEIYKEPLEIVVQTLEKYKTYKEMINNFPDIEIGRTNEY